MVSTTLPDTVSGPTNFNDPNNTVKKVFIQNPQPGNCTTRVKAEQLIATQTLPSDPYDNHLETPWMDADYALVVSSGPRPRGQCCHPESEECSWIAASACTAPGFLWFSERTCADACQAPQSGENQRLVSATLLP